MKCCVSCQYWEKASKRVPIDVVRVAKADSIDVQYEGKVLKARGWDWRLAHPVTLGEIRARRLCFYGKGMVRPWEECRGFLAKVPMGVTLCQAGQECDFSARCPKLRQLISYVT